MPGIEWNDTNGYREIIFVGTEFPPFFWGGGGESGGHLRSCR